MGALADVKQDWDSFKDDEPGRRFRRQNGRLKNKPTAVRAAMAIGGIVLLAGGVVLCFIPGPGLPLIVFGFALLAGLSRSLARTLDRAEPVLRHKAKQARRGWSGLSRGAQVLAVAAAVVAVGSIGVGVYRLIT